MTLATAVLAATFANPVLPADFSDIDCVRSGDRFYAITSTLHCSPGMDVLESSDMVNWQVVGHVVADTSVFGEDWTWKRMRRYGRGVWAGCIRERALDYVRWFYTNITNGHRHWDSQFRWPHAEGWYMRAAELLRYTGPKTGPLAWTKEDTEGVNRFIAIGEDFWWGRGTLLNQLQFTLGGPLARAIWRDDWNMYCEMVEILTANKQGPVGERNGSIRVTFAATNGGLAGGVFDVRLMSAD